MDKIETAKAILKVERAIAKVEDKLAGLKAERARLLAALGGGGVGDGN